MSKKHISVDFDGVIHMSTSKWEGPDVIKDDPVPGAIAFLINLIEHGYTPAIHSTRSATLAGRLAMKDWLYSHLVSYCNSPVDAQDWLEGIEWPATKPPAILTIDDRAFHFKGEFPSLEYIQNFKPWNK